MKELTKEQKITLNFIIKSAKSEVDLKWKLGKYINNNGDLSFLGTTISDLKKEIKESEKISATITN